MKSKNAIVYCAATGILSAFIAACSGGGGSGSSPAPSPTPIPTPAPTPSPTPAPSVSAIHFAPYIDTGMQDVDITNWSQATGNNYVTLAFFNSTGGCTGGWPVAENGLITSTQALQANGGQVIVSTGGWNGRDLALACNSAASIAAAYQGVLARFGTTYLDIDPEHGTIYNNLDANVVDRRSSALKILQDNLAAVGKPIHLSFTLGVTPDTGFNSENLYVLQSAHAAGVVFDVVNPMIMDYYDGVSGSQMGDRSILALQKAMGQVKTLLPGKTDAEYWAMMSATPMIGQNDDPQEVFTLVDAQKILDFARSENMARLSFWSLSRDNGNCAGQATAQANCSGIAQSQWAFSNVFGAY